MSLNAKSREMGVVELGSLENNTAARHLNDDSRDRNELARLGKKTVLKVRSWFPILSLSLIGILSLLYLCSSCHDRRKASTSVANGIRTEKLRFHVDTRLQLHCPHHLGRKSHSLLERSAEWGPGGNRSWFSVNMAWQSLRILYSL